MNSNFIDDYFCLWFIKLSKFDRGDEVKQLYEQIHILLLSEFLKLLNVNLS